MPANRVDSKPAQRPHPLRPEIRDSWERSRQFGIKPDTTALPRMDQQELQLKQKKNKYLITPLQFIVDYAVEHLPPGWVSLFFDTQCCLMYIMGKEEDVNAIRKAGFSEGTIWREEVAGTNAVGLGFAQATPTTVVGDEHFCAYGRDFACAFAPFFDQNRIFGGYAILGPAESYGPHALGMAVSTAGNIGTRFVLDTYNRIVNNSISEGMLVLSDENLPLYVNSSLFRTLNLPYHPACDMSSLDDLFDPGNPDNRQLRTIIERPGDISGKSVAITVGDKKTYFTLTSKTFNAPHVGMSGKVVLFQEEARLKGLLRNYVGRGANTSFGDIIGNNQKFRRTIAMASAASSSSSNVLILGESGTGKDLIAQAIHNASARGPHSFLAINCASLPRELIASELFGYEEGAFTGARKGGNIGKFELADGGTLFLDEIGDMPRDLQATLLRVLEEKKVMRLGGSSMIPVDVRIIAATNKDLESEVVRGSFRRDLYYRLGVIRIKIPPLRERPDDIPVLAEHFTEQLCRRLNLENRSLAPEVIAEFLRYSWPGNIRELQNILEGTIQMASGPIITREMIEDYLPPWGGISDSQHDQLFSRDKPEEQVIQSLLCLYDNNKSKVARAMGISRRTLYKRMAKYGMDLA